MSMAAHSGGETLIANRNIAQASSPDVHNQSETKTEETSDIRQQKAGSVHSGGEYKIT